MVQESFAQEDCPTKHHGEGVPGPCIRAKFNKKTFKPLVIGCLSNAASLERNTVFGAALGYEGSLFIPPFVCELDVLK